MIELEKFPDQVDFRQKTEVVSVSFYPIRDKAFKNITVAKKMNMILTLEITVILSGFVLPKYKNVLRQEVDEETLLRLTRHLKKQKQKT